MGLSTGGTMPLVTAAKRPDIVGAVALSPFASLKRILEDYPPCREILEARFGTLRPKDYRTADALKWASIDCGPLFGRIRELLLTPS